MERWGVAFFAIWGCDRGDGRAGGLCCFFLRCGADHVGVFVGIVRNSGTIGYERGVTNAGTITEAVSPGSAPVEYALRKISGTR